MKKHILKVWMILAISFLAMNVAGQSYTADYPNVSDVTPGSIKVNVAGDFGGSTRWILSEVETGWDNQYVLDNGQVTSMYFFSVSFNVPVDPSKTYYLYLVSSSVYPTAGTVESAPTVIQFNTPAAPAPLTATLNPFDNAPDISVNTSSFVLTFSEAIKYNSTGTYFIRLYESGGSTHLAERYINQGDPQTGLLIDPLNNTLSIDFGYQLDYSKEYYITIPADAIWSDNLTSVAYAGLAANDWSFKTEAEPIAVDPPAIVPGTMLPAPEDTVVSRAPTFEVRFDKQIQWGEEGVFRLRRMSNDSIVKTISPNETGTAISADLLSITFTSPALDYGTEYYVQITNDFVRSLEIDGALPFPGVSKSDNWTFTTESAPPFWAEGYPLIRDQNANTFDLVGQVDQTGTYYYVVAIADDQLNHSTIFTAATSGGNGGFLLAGYGAATANAEFFTGPLSTTSLEYGQNYYLFVYTASGDKNSEIIRIDIDRVVPRLLDQGTYPSAGYSVMPVNDAIVLNFSEKLYAVDNDILVEIPEANAVSYIQLLEVVGEQPIVSTITIGPEGRLYTITPDAPLSENTSYKVVIGTVSDVNGNVAVIPDHTFSTDKIQEWIGGVTDPNNWFETSNWSTGEFVSGKSVVISGSANVFPIVKEGDKVSVHNLTIEPTAVLTQTGGTINVSGEFHLLSSAERNASYLPKGGALNVEGADVDKVFVHQTIPVPNDDWIFLMGAPTLSADAVNSGSGYQMRWYDNKTDTWNNNNFDKMVPGVGYSVYADKDLVLRGEINRMDVSTSLTRTVGKGLGWNVLGNPFPASMSWDLIVNDSENDGVLDKIENNYWVWDPSNAIYDAYNGVAGVGVGQDGIIPSNHGFLVKVKIGEDSANLKLKSNSLVPNSLSYLKSASKAPEHFKLKAGNVDFEDKLAVAFIDEATVGVDKFDTEKRFGSGKNPFEIFTLAGSSRLTINSLPYAEEQMVALGYSASKTGSYSIAMDEFVAEGISVELIDHDNGVITNLSAEDAYTFNVGSKGVNTTRFTLKLIGSLTTKIDDSSSSLDSFSLLVEDQIVWVSAGRSLSGTTYRVHDVSGRMMAEGKFSDGYLHNLGSFNPGVYLVTINGEEMHHVQKIVVY